MSMKITTSKLKFTLLYQCLQRSNNKLKEKLTLFNSFSKLKEKRAIQLLHKENGFSEICMGRLCLVRVLPLKL